VPAKFGASSDRLGAHGRACQGSFHGLVFLRGSITACACLWAMAAWHALVSWAPRPLTQAGVITGYLTEQFGKVLHRFGVADFCLISGS